MPSLPSKIRANVDLAGHSRPLVLSRVSTSFKLESSSHSLSSNSYLASLAAMDAAVAGNTSPSTTGRLLQQFWRRITLTHPATA